MQAPMLSIVEQIFTKIENTKTQKLATSLTFSFTIIMKAST